MAVFLKKIGNTLRRSARIRHPLAMQCVLQNDRNDRGALADASVASEEGFPGENRRVPLSSKNLDVSKWLVESGMDGDADYAFANACGEGPMPVVWWLADHLHAKNITLGPEAAQDALDSAAEHGRLKVEKWLLERNIGNDTTWSIHVAASNGHLSSFAGTHWMCARNFGGCCQSGHLTSSSGCGLSLVMIRKWTYFACTAGDESLYRGHHHWKLISATRPATAI